MNFLLRMLIFSVMTLTLQAKIIQDTNAQPVNVPDRVNKVFGSSPPMNYLIYAINPKKMVGLNFDASNGNNHATQKFVSPAFLSLPIIGSFHGGGKNINLETLMRVKPDLILVWQDDMVVQTVEKSIEKTKIPSITIPFRGIEEMPKAIRFAAEALNEPKRGKVLASFAEKKISHVRKVVKNLKPTRYYYAEGADGLSTECDSSFHIEALNFAGGQNVQKCQQSGVLGMEKISFEKLLAYDPDVVIVQSNFTYNAIMKNPLWKNLRAIKAGNVHLVPNTPFNWVDRPPSFMRIIGIEWLAGIFHPKEFKVNLTSEIREFYQVFLGVKLSNSDIKNITHEGKVPQSWAGCSK